MKGSCTDLANLISGVGAIPYPVFRIAAERIVAGLEKRNRILNPHERKVVACHEMGHALVAMAIPGVDPVQKISIIPHGIGALGYTIQRPLEDRFLMDRNELMNRMSVLHGGRAAESLVFENVSTGATDDLAKVTEIARSMVVRFGMDPKLGQVAYETDTAPLLGMLAGADWRPRHYGEETAGAIDTAIRDLWTGPSRRPDRFCRRIVHLLDQAAAELLSEETMSGEDLWGVSARLAPAATSAKGPALAAATTGV